MADLFLSYAHADAGRARQIVDALEARGLGVWWDPHLEYGKDFRAGIVRQISDASCVVVLWSRASLESPYVVAEATEGMEQGKLLPVLLERNLKLPLGLGHLQAANLSDWNTGTSDEPLNRLVEAIRAFTARVETDTVASGRATDVRSLAPSEIRARAYYLKNARRHVENLLSASIHSARFLDLGIADTPRATRVPWVYKDAAVEREFGSVSEAFEAFDRRMLLLGAPGAGKTVTLLHLALDLITEAERSSAAPVPLVVNLSRFVIEAPAPSLVDRLVSTRTEPPDRNRAFETWLAGELAARGIGGADASRWAGEGRIAALLDGLDEVNDERRSDVAELLNTTYFSHHPHSFVVVCSRIADYQPLQERGATRLRLTGAVTLQPLDRERIADYLTAARASGLRRALGRDDALFELARTPLTLSMMTLAFGGLSPDDVPSFGAPSNQRHQLLEAFVARMLQRTERRVRDIAFDDDVEREVPPKHYRFHPERVNAYLGWLATRSSVRTQTSCSLRSLYSFLARTNTPEQSPDLWAVRLAQTTFFGAIVAALGIVMMPLDGSVRSIATLLAVAFGCMVIYVAYSLLRAHRPRKSTWMGMAIGSVFIFPGFAAISHSLATLLPFELTPVPAGLLAAALVLALIGRALEFGTGARRSVLAASTAIGCAAGAIAISLGWVAWTGGAPLAAATIAGLTTGICIVMAREQPGGPVEHAKGVAIVLVLLACVLLIQTKGLEVLGSLRWEVAFALLGSALVLIAVGARPSLPLLVVAMAAAAGHLAAGSEGSILAAVLVGVIWLVWTLEVGETGHGKKLTEAAVRLAKRFETLIEHAVLSPLTAKSLAARGRLPWRIRRFLRYCGDALLVKPFDGEIEFVHRSLRDYFALRELVPQLEAADNSARTRTIAAIGFQGVSAVDTLSDLAQDGGAAEKVLAVKALGRIAAPEATQALERTMADPNPDVRAAVVGSLRHVYEQDRQNILDKAADDDAPAVQHALIDATSELDLPFEPVVRLMKRRAFPVDLLRHICATTGTDSRGTLAHALGAELPETAHTQVSELLRDSEASVRMRASEWVAENPKLGDVDVLVNLLRDDPVPLIRASAASALAEIEDAAAIPPLIAALSDRIPAVHLSAARALARFDDERVDESLIGLLQHESEGTREVAAKLLGDRGDDRAAEWLIHTLDDDVRAVRCEATRALKKLGDPRAAEPLATHLADPDDVFWQWVAIALLALDAGRASAALRPFLSDKSPMKRTMAVQALAVDLDGVPAALLARDVDDPGLWLDPAVPITRERVAKCASSLNLSEQEIRAQYEALAPEFKLRLKW